MPALFEVLAPGLLTTVQDLGRPDLGHLGIAPGGACDPRSLAMANLLVDNAPGAAALELTLVGPDLRLMADATVALAGADLGGVVRATGRRLAPGRSHRLEAGATIAFPGVGPSEPGARAYLAIPGGVDVPLVLGAAATCLGGGFGGVDGRPLHAGDVISAAAADLRGPQRAWPPSTLGDSPNSRDPAVIRVVDTAGLWPRLAKGYEALVESSWTVGPASDRTGLRLEGRALRLDRGGELVSHGLPWGAVQVPPDGRPIVLLADGGPSGGYPVVAVAITADRPALGQLRPGATVRFAAVRIEDARAALRAQREVLARGPSAVEPSGAWDDLWRSAGS